MKTYTSIEYFKTNKTILFHFFPNIFRFGASFIQIRIGLLVAIGAIVNETTHYLQCTVAHKKEPTNEDKFD